MTVASDAMMCGWLVEQGERVVDPLLSRRLGAGQSNLTFLLTDAEGNDWILRRPTHTSGEAAQRAVRREVTILRALAETPIPVPKVVGHGVGDAGVEGPFFVMHKAQGSPVATESDAAALTATDRLNITADVVRVLADLHTIDPVEVGLETLAEGGGYMVRQIDRIARSWHEWGSTSASHSKWIKCHRLFEAGMPRCRRPAIVHGDYRLSNLLVHGGRLSSVLDWELSTIGDPLADLAWLLDDWRGPAEPKIAMPSPTRVGGFPDRNVLVMEYESRTGLNVDELERYRAFTHWKAATLLQGVVVRRRSGLLGDHGSVDPVDLEETIEFLLDNAMALA